jgi:hypothetical protein
VRAACNKRVLRGHISRLPVLLTSAEERLSFVVLSEERLSFVALWEERLNLLEPSDMRATASDFFSRATCCIFAMATGTCAAACTAWPRPGRGLRRLRRFAHWKIHSSSQVYGYAKSALNKPTMRAGTISTF